MIKRKTFTIYHLPFKLNAGFSIPELLVYAAILGFILAFVIGGMLAMADTVTAARVSRDLNVSAVTALERMEREIKDASSVATTSSTLGTSPGVLVINTTNASTTGGTMQFSISGGKLVLTQGGVVSELTSGNISINSLIFYATSTTHSSSVRILLSVQATGTPVRVFSDTAVLRESYVQ